MKEKGISLLLTILVLSVILAISSTMAIITLRELKISSGIEESTVAFFAADTGIERGLYEVRQNNNTSTITGTLDTINASYTVEFFSPDGECSAENCCLRSKGTFKKTERAIESSF